MSTRGPLRPLARLLPPSPAAGPLPRRTLHNFLERLCPNPADTRPLHINVTRTLPYPRAKLYALIVDVDAYERFLPFCQRSRVTARSAPDAATGARWPTEGELTIGAGFFSRSYTSRIVCEPGRSVEAHSGADEPLAAARDGAGNPFQHLVTRWTVEDAPPPPLPSAAAAAEGVGEAAREWTKVNLDVRVQLVDSLLHAVLSARGVGDTVESVIEAFEKRARA